MPEQFLEEDLETAMLHDSTMSPRDTRRQRGQVLRESIPHRAHAGWKAPANRPSPVEILEKSNQGRIPELIPVRYGRMLPSAFTFYRGAAALMAWDLSNTPNSGINVQACGDCHLLNFGAFATPERNIVFDINDFDETLPAPWEWDLKRLAVSFVLAARDNGLKDKYVREVAEAVGRAYRHKMVEYTRKSILDIWYDRVDWQTVIDSTSDERLQELRKGKLKKEMKRTIQDHYLPRLTQQLNGKFTFKDSPPQMYHLAEKKGREDFFTRVQKALSLYKESLQEDKQALVGRYQLEDVAIKVVGIGSVGTFCAVALLFAPDNEPLILQMKEARPSVLEPYVGRSEYSNQGRRVVAGQRIAQSASDIFLGWTELDGKHFYIRQLRDTKLKPEPEIWEGPHMLENAEHMGQVLARAHARTGDAATIRGYLGTHETFDEALREFSLDYANQVEKDYEELMGAVSTGKIKAVTEQEDDS
ncbi:MAG TPA: DUF2252 domain-containing protein [Planktothrix sp.]|jgi:uncharacterized protein (DUF2252 family)